MIRIFFVTMIAVLTMVLGLYLFVTYEHQGDPKIYAVGAQ